MKLINLFLIINLMFCLVSSTPMNCKLKVNRGANSVSYPKKTIKTGYVCTFKFSSGSWFEGADGDKRLAEMCDSVEKTLSLSGQVLTCELKDAKWEAIITEYLGVPIIFSEKAYAEVNRPLTEWHKHAISTCTGFLISLKNMPLSVNSVQSLNQAANNCQLESALQSKYSTNSDELSKKLIEKTMGSDVSFWLGESIKLISNYKITASPQDVDLLKFYSIMKILLKSIIDNKLPQTTASVPEADRSVVKNGYKKIMLQITKVEYERSISSDWYLKIYSFTNNQERLAMAPGLLSSGKSFQYEITLFDEKVWFEIWEKNRLSKDSKVGKGSTERKIINEDSAKIWPSDKPLTIHYKIN
jgi:hypothetical protein